MVVGSIHQCDIVISAHLIILFLTLLTHWHRAMIQRWVSFSDNGKAGIKECVYLLDRTCITTAVCSWPSYTIDSNSDSNDTAMTRRPFAKPFSTACLFSPWEPFSRLCYLFLPWVRPVKPFLHCPHANPQRVLLRGLVHIHLLEYNRPGRSIVGTREWLWW